MRFGPYELDPLAGELRKHGQKIRLQDQPLHLLILLIEKHGELVTREEIQQRLWATDTFVDFEHGLNTAVRKVRAALNDSATNPRYIETLPRRGYRFIGQVTPEQIAAEQTSPPPVSVAKQRRPTLVIVGVSAAVFAITGLLLSRNSPLEPKAYRPVPLTQYIGVEVAPSFSPDGSQVAFSWNGQNQDNFDIYVKVIGQEKPIRLTTDPAWDDKPAWSPDGRWIAFVREVSLSRYSVILVPALGGSERKLTEITRLALFSNTCLSWFPDSKRLLVTDQEAEEPGRLYVLQVETGERQPLQHPTLGHLRGDGPTVSPDGRRVAFYTGRTPDDAKVHVGFVDGTGAPLEQVGPNDVACAVALWVGDSALTVVCDGVFWLAGIGTGRPRMLWSRGGYSPGFSPAISLARHRLAFSEESWDGNLYRLDLESPENAQSSPSFVFGSSVAEAQPQISPDDRYIIFRSKHDQGNHLWRCDRDGSNPIKITSLKSDTGSPRWSPDGKRIVFDSYIQNSWEIYVARSDGGEVKRLTAHTASDFGPSWSRDGRWIYFSSTRSGSEEVWKMAADGGVPIRVTTNGGSVPLESLDGKWLYYLKLRNGPGELWRAPLSGGDEERVAGNVLARDYAPVDHGVYFIGLIGGGRAIQYLRLRDRKVVILHRLDKDVLLGVSLAPDGRSLVYSQLDSYTADLMLVENFP